METALASAGLGVDHTPVRVCLIADTHGVLDARVEAVVSTCDAVVHAGDIGGGCVLQALRPRGGVIVAIKGNNDVVEKWAEEDRQQLSQLSDRAHLELPGGRLLVVHGDRHLPAKQRHARLRSAYPNARGVVYGHSHRLVVDDSRSPWILNPGAAGRVRTYGGPACIVLSVTSCKWRIETLRFETIKVA